MKLLKRRFFVLLYCAVFIGVICITQLISQSVTVMVENGPITDRTIIVIDPGHGGIDGGATACNGILESKTNLEIGLKLNDLMHLLGFETKMTRKTDTSIHTEGNTIASQKVSDLKNRVKMVNETPNAILVSIHQNTFSNSKYSGPQVFYCKNSDNFAKEMQDALNNSLAQNSKRTAKQGARIYLMEHIEKPGILIECGFISNAEDATKLNDPIYQNNLCCAIASVISRYGAIT